MFLREMFKPTKKVVAEGGNVSSTSPGWQGAADQEAEEIDLKIHDRDFMVGQLRELLVAQNESFRAAYGKYIWDPKLLASGQMFSGSSLQFFDVKGVNTQDFMNKLKKTKVGDIDTQIDQDMGDEVTAWLKSIIGKKVGNGTFLGFNSSLSSIWLLDDPQVRVQVDYELGPYQPAQGKEPARPTEWFAYSHSSHYDDMAAGIKGVFHKYINRALTHAQSSTKYVARVLKKGVKISDAPVTDSDYSFAVSSAQGGGMSVKYKPYIDPTTGQPMEKDGIPVMQQLDPKDRDYIQNLDQQFQINFGRKRTDKDKNLQGSFVGTLQLMNKSFTPEQNEDVARAFIDILFGPGAQMITKDDPDRDRDTKFAAVDAMLLGGDGIKPLNLPNGKGMRQEAVQTAMDYADKFKAKRAGKLAQPDTEVAEDADAAAAAKPNYARQGIKHLYNRLPDGRVSSVEMKDAEFLEVAKDIAANGGTLNGFPINLKVDGAGIRFGKDASGRPFFMTSKVTQPLYQDDVGYFTSFGQQRGQDAEQLARTKNYDDALALITGSKFIQTLPTDTIVQAEMLYNPMAEKTDQGLKFVNIPYDPKKLGKQMTLVPFMFKQYSTGEERPDADNIKKRLLASGDSNIKIISNSLEQKGINVSKIINPILNLDPKDKANKPAFDKAKQELSTAIIDNPKLAGKDALGNNMEGIVVNMPNGKLFKVTSQQMKTAMAAKMAQPGVKREGPLKTAVVAIGSFAGHKGHQELFKYTIDKAKQVGGEPYLFMGNAVGKDDPIPVADKLKTWHQLYPQYAKNISGTMEGGSLMQKIKHELINPMPGQPPKYDNIFIMVGEDQANMPIANALMKAVTKFPGYEHVKVTLEVTPRGTGMSFTQLRNSLKTDDEQTAFNKWNNAFNGGNFGAQKLPPQWINHLMDVSRTGMGITQQPQPTQPAPQAAPQPIAESRLLNALIRSGRDMCNVCGQTPCNCTTIEEARMSAAVKLQRAWEREQSKSTASRKRGEEVMAQAKKDAENKSKEQQVSEYGDTAKGQKMLTKVQKRAVDRVTSKKADTDPAYAKKNKDTADRAWDRMKDVAEALADTQQKIQDTINKLEDRLKHAKTPEQWDNINNRIERLQAGLKRSKQGVAEGSTSHAELAKMAHDAYVAASRKGNGPMAAHYLKQYQKHKADAAKEKKGVAEGWKEKVGAAALAGAVATGAGANTPKVPLDKAIQQATAVYNINKAVKKHKEKEAEKRKSDEKQVKETGSSAMAQTAQRLTDPNDGKTAKLRAAGDKRREDQLKSRDIAKRNEAMLPKSAFAGSDKNKLGPAAHAKGKQKGPVKQGQFVGGMEEDKIKGADGKACWKGKRYAGTKNGKDICVPVSEDVENIMAALIENILRK